MADIIRDAAIGQLIRWATNNRYLQYPEEKPDFQLPQAWLDIINDTNESGYNATKSSLSLENSSENNNNNTATAVTDISPDARLEADEIHNLEKQQSTPVAPQRTKDGAILVDWYFTDDDSDPHNWTNKKRMAIFVIICLYTFIVYTTSAIYTSSTEGIMKEFNVSLLHATLGLSLYVLGYGIGPLVFSPLSEIPRIGRNPVYIVTMFLFVIISIPTALVDNFAGLMVLRFLQGFFGSPCLASGGASLGDMYSLFNLPYAMMAWVSAAYCGRKFFSLVHTTSMETSWKIY